MEILRSVGKRLARHVQNDSPFKQRVSQGRGYLIGLWILSNLVLVFIDIPWLVLPSAALVFGFLPGFLLTGVLFKGKVTISPLERFVVSAATSYGLSSLALLLVHFIPGPLTRSMVMVTLNGVILSLLILDFCRRDTSLGKGAGIDGASRPSGHHSEPNERSRSGDRCLAKPFADVLREVAPIFILVALIGFFRFVSLGYSEYQGDEIDVTSLARLAISGEDDALFLHRKGPVELVTAAAFALFSGSFDEFAIRFPFALSSGWAILGTYALGRQLWGRQIGLLAGALFAVNGIFLGFSRMVQYQGIVALMLISAVLCYYRLNRAEHVREETPLGVLGLGLWGVGLLTHYEAGPLLLVLAFLYVQKHPVTTWQWRTVRPLFIAAVIVMVALLAYYIPFMTHEQFGNTFQRYTEIRISPERMPFNNLGDYLTSSLFYNSIYYESLMALGILLAAWSAIRRAFGNFTVPGTAIWLALAIGLLGGAIVPSWCVIGEIHLPVFLCLPALLVLIFNRRNPVVLRAIFLWFGMYLTAYAFLIRVPGLHYYTLLPAYALLAAWGLKRQAAKLMSRSPVWRYAIASCALLLGIILLYYPHLLFTRTMPEYALSYPQHRNPLYWNTLTGPPQRFFGLPHRSGWRTVGYLLAEGRLNGDYRSNEKEEITSWYTGYSPAQSERPKYYLIADNATNKEHKQDYPIDLISTEYGEIGGVAVSGELRLHIYELRPSEEQLGIFQDEALTSRRHEDTEITNREEAP